jgi:hypothetical protein
MVTWLPKTKGAKSVSGDVLEVPLPELEVNFDKERNSLTSSTENRLVEEVKKWQKGQNGTYRHPIEAH